MGVLPQIEPITRLQRDHKSVFEQLANGPIVLAQHSKAAAVLVSVEEWNNQAKELARYRRIFLAEERSKEMEEDPIMRIPFTKEELIKRGVLNG